MNGGNMKGDFTARTLMSLGVLAAFLADRHWNWLWGTNLCGLWPLPARVLLLFPAMAVIWFPFHRMSRWNGTVSQPAAAALVIPALSLVAFWWFLPCKTMVFGDGIEFGDRLSPGTALAPRSPLFNVIVGGLTTGLFPHNEAGLYSAIRLISLLSGVLFVCLISLSWHRNFRYGGLTSVAVFTGGYVCLFQQYIESYPLFLVILSGYCLSLMDPLPGRRRILVVALQVLVLATHTLGLALLPVTVVIFAGEPPGRSRRLLVFGAGLLLVFVLLRILGPRLPVSIDLLRPESVELYLRPRLEAMVRPRLWKETFAISTLGGICGLMNSIVLAAGPAVILCFSLLLLPGGVLALRRAAFSPLGASAGILLLTRCAVTTPLGAFLDWDLYSCFVVPAIFVVAKAWSDPAMRTWSARFAGPAMTVALIGTVPFLLVLHQPERATLRCESYLAGLPPPFASEAAFVEFRLGDELAGKGRHREAAEAFGRAFDLDGRNIYARRAGSSALKSGDVARAIREFSRALDANPWDAVSLEQRGFLLMSTGNPAAASNDFRMALEVTPGQANVLMGAGTVEMQRGNSEDGLRFLDLAEQAYRRDLARGDNSISTHAFLAQVLQVTRRYPEAIAEWKTVVDRESRNTTAWYNLGECCLAAARPIEAINALEQASRSTTDPCSVLARLGVAYLAAGKREKAIEILEKALAMNKECRPARDALDQLVPKDP